MNLVRTIAALRLGYHLNMIDFCNVANQLHLLSNEKANQKNKNHLKECIDCYERLGYVIPKEFVDFKEEA